MTTTPADRYGICQVCGRTATAYSQEPLPLNLDSRRLASVRPLSAEPCGHLQPRVVTRTGESMTYPTATR